MKEWNTPSVEELNVAETANGHFDFYFETTYVVNDSLKVTNAPDNRDDENDSGNQLS